MKKLLAAATFVGLILLGQSTAHAVPILQLYIEGATYDEITETWVYPGIAGTRLWAIGNVSGPGNAGPIDDVRLAVAYDAALEGHITITLTPTLIGGSDTLPGTFQGFVDRSLTPDLNPDNLDPHPVEHAEGTIPTLSDGRDLPRHAAYGPGVSWQEFFLGDFSNGDPTDSIANFIPAEDAPAPFDITTIDDDDIYDTGGRINVYEVSWSIGDSTLPPLTELHFDLYDNVQATNKAKFAPFSHEASATPEPASFIIWFLIGLTWAGRGWAYQYWHRWRQWEREETAVAANMGGRRQSGAAVRSADAIESHVKTGPAGGAAIGRAQRHSSF